MESKIRGYFFQLRGLKKGILEGISPQGVISVEQSYYLPLITQNYEGKEFDDVIRFSVWSAYQPLYGVILFNNVLVKFLIVVKHFPDNRVVKPLFVPFSHFINKMTTLSPIKIPPPSEESAPPNNEEDKQKWEQLRNRLMLEVDEGKFKFSREVVKRAPHQYLKEIDGVYYRQRALVFVKRIFRIGAHIIAHMLHWADFIGKDEVKDVIADITEDEALEQDVLWLFGDLMGPGFVGVVGGVGVRVIKHKFRRGAAMVAKKVAKDVKTVRRERLDSISSVSSLSDGE